MKKMRKLNKNDKIIELTDEDLKKLQATEMELLEEFVRVCDKYNLKYVLMGGSCLGAIRHNGFIPWDDDIDVALNRDDYDTFVKVQEHELNDKYYFDCMENDEDHNLVQGKLKKKGTIASELLSNLPVEKQGIWLDIFPLDKVSDNDKVLKKEFYKVFCTKIMISFKLGNEHHSKSKAKELVLRLLKFASHFINLEKTKKKLYKLMTKHNIEDTKRVISYGSGYLLKAVFDKDYCNDRILHEFEGKKYYITKNYDRFLKQFYGDYMKLPPEEKRHPVHSLKKIKF